jgi:hypothetical protein
MYNYILCEAFCWYAVAGQPYLLLDEKHDVNMVTVIIKRVKAKNLFFIV